MAATIKALTEFAAPILPSAEETRLNALSSTLEFTATAVLTGDMDLSTAKSTVSSALTLAFETLGGIDIGVLMSGIGSYATSLAPLPPHVKGAIIGGAGVFGFLLDSAIGDSGIYDDIASGLTNAIFDGAQAISNVLTQIVESIENDLNPISGDPVGIIDLSVYEPSPATDDNRGADPTWVSSAAFADPLERVESLGNTGGGTGPGPRDPLRPDDPLAMPTPLTVEPLEVSLPQI